MCNCNTNCGCNTTPCPPSSCTCPVLLTAECTEVTSDLTCSNILKGQTLTEVLIALDTYICERFDSVTNFFDLVNVGTGSQIYKGVSILGKKEIRTLVDSGLINLVTATDTITISVDETALNTFIEVNQKTYSALNTGTGAQVYKNSTIIGDNTQFNLRKIKSSDSSVTITEGTDDINLTVSSSIIPDGSETKVTQGTNITLTGTGTIATPYIINGLYPPFNKTNNGYFTRDRNETQFGTLGAFSFDFSDANIGALADPYGQVGQNGVHPTEQYGAIGESNFLNGYNISGEGYGDVIFGIYNHSNIQSQFSTILGRNNYNDSYNSLISGSYNRTPYTYLGHKVVFGNGNVVNGTAGLTSGVALLNKSFGTTVLGQANADYTNTEQTHNLATAPILIVGNGDVAVPVGIWSATSRTNALVMLKNGLTTLPSVTNALIAAEPTGKAIVTKEYLTSVAPDGSETKLTAGTNVTITGVGTTATPYVINSATSDGSETKITAGTNVTVTGTGTTATPYVINNTAASPFLRKATYVLGDAPIGTDQMILISFPDVGTSNYMVLGSLVSNSVDFDTDNDVFFMIKNKTSTGFNLALREVANIIQNISFDYALLAF